jgi:hypothetical protein
VEFIKYVLNANLGVLSNPEIAIKLLQIFKDIVDCINTFKDIPDEEMSIVKISSNMFETIKRIVRDGSTYNRYISIVEQHKTLDGSIVSTDDITESFVRTILENLVNNSGFNLKNTPFWNLNIYNYKTSYRF